MRNGSPVTQFLSGTVISNWLCTRRASLGWNPAALIAHTASRLIVLHSTAVSANRSGQNCAPRPSETQLAGTFQTVPVLDEPLTTMLKSGVIY
jgi:hypothetical protein